MEEGDFIILIIRYYINTLELSCGERHRIPFWIFAPISSQRDGAGKVSRFGTMIATMMGEGRTVPLRAWLFP